MNKYKIVSLNNISEARRKLIKEAMSLKNKEHAVANGWQHIGSGAYKHAYKKGNIVVKFPNIYQNNSCLAEGNLYTKVKYKHKKYFARVYAFNKSRNIQEYIKGKKMSKKSFDTLTKVLSEYKIIDFAIGHNTGTRAKIPVIFDYMVSGY